MNYFKYLFTALQIAEQIALLESQLVNSKPGDEVMLPDITFALRTGNIHDVTLSGAKVIVKD